MAEESTRVLKKCAWDISEPRPRGLKVTEYIYSDGSTPYHFTPLQLRASGYRKAPEELSVYFNESGEPKIVPRQTAEPATA